MKIARFSRGDSIAYGVIDDEEIVVLAGDPLVSGYETTGERVPRTDVKLLAPVIPRSKIVAVGKNYRDHVDEMAATHGASDQAPEEPLLFLKPNTSVIGPEDSIVLPTQSQRVEYEAELAVIIGRVAKNVAPEDVPGVIFGYTAANDVTARDLQFSDGQWARAKGFDTFCPLGPIVETDLDPAGQELSARVNGAERQRASTGQMIHDVAAIISYASHVFTLLPGDVILTGTPAGVGAIVSGDRVEVEISGIGVLSNPVVASSVVRAGG